MNQTQVVKQATKFTRLQQYCAKRLDQLADKSNIEGAYFPYLIVQAAYYDNILQDRVQARRLKVKFIKESSKYNCFNPNILICQDGCSNE